MNTTYVNIEKHMLKNDGVNWPETVVLYSLVLKMTSACKSCRIKTAILWSRIFPNVKDFFVTLITTVIALNIMFYMTVQRNKKPKQTRLLSKVHVSFKPKIHQLTNNGAWCWFADPRAIYYRGK